MKRILAIATVLVTIFPYCPSSFSSPSGANGVWVEDTQMSYAGTYDSYCTFASGFDPEASNSTYLSIDYKPGGQGTKLTPDSKYLPIEFMVDSKNICSFEELWLSWSAAGDKPEVVFEAENFDIQSPKTQNSRSTFIEKGNSYGNGFQWDRFGVSDGMDYGLPARYKLRMLIDASKPFKIKIDAMYIGNGKWRPQDSNPEFAPETFYTEKVMFWTLPITSVFKNTLQPSKSSIISKIDVNVLRGHSEPFVLAITGGVNLGDVEISLNKPLVSGNAQANVEFFTVSYMKKRFNINGPVSEKVEMAEYISKDSKLVIPEGRTGFFWLKFSLPEQSQEGIFKGLLKIKNAATEDLYLPINLRAWNLDLPKNPECLMFQATNHIKLVQKGKVSPDDGWKRYKSDFDEMASRGVNSVVLPVPLVSDPPYMPDLPKLENLAKMASSSGFNRFFMDITEAYGLAKKSAPEELKSELSRSLEQSLSTIRKIGLEPIIYIGKTTSELDDGQKEMFSIATSINATPRTACHFTLWPDQSQVDFPIIDWAVIDYTVIQRQGKLPEGVIVNFQPSPHWGMAHQSRVFAGAYAYAHGLKYLSFGNYQQYYGDPFNDFDQMLGDGSYTPGDSMWTYVNESYNVFHSIRWECLLEGIKDRQLLDLLNTKMMVSKGEPAVKAGSLLGEAFEGKDWQSLRLLSLILDPAKIALFREKVIGFISWLSGGEKVAPFKTSYKIDFVVGSKELKFGEEKLQMTVEPKIIGGSTYIPARYLVEPLGGKALWDAKTKTVSLVAVSKHVNLVINSKKAIVDTEEVTLTNAPLIVDGRTLIPLRAASTLLGFGVEWDAQTRTATIIAGSKETYLGQ